MLIFQQAVNLPECPHTTFYTENTYNACKPGVKAAVHKQAVNGSGVRVISRCLGISTDTVIAELKKVVTKKNTLKIERKHLSLRTWCSRLVRKGIRFSKTEQMHKIVVGLIINVWFFGCHWLIQ
ncbi:MAG: hypothetical protein LBU65_04185 [Planctomycetaceae bacterium]|nr:hypothetical protein [Planctomycetaceae bacterium]